MKNAIFRKALLLWYKKNARVLPWRLTKDPYKIWISEIMLQQTTVTAVIPFYERWIKLFPDVYHVTEVSLQEILKCWQGLGYYQRAKNIQKSAKIMVRNYGGKVPSNEKELRQLPGFGPYTVGAVLSIAFDQRKPIIDANIRRLVMRLLGIRNHQKSKNDSAIISFLNHIMPQKRNNIFNQALMELGALICRSRQPLCLQCPIKKQCKAYEDGTQEIIPAPRKIIIRKIEASVGVIKRKNRFLIQRRPQRGLFADLWEFPGGKIKKGETPREALYREIKEELGIDINSVKFLFSILHYYTQFRVKLHVWECQAQDDFKPMQAHRWVPRNALHKYPMPSGSSQIVDHLTSLK